MLWRNLENLSEKTPHSTAYQFDANTLIYNFIAPDETTLTNFVIIGQKYSLAVNLVTNHN